MWEMKKTEAGIQCPYPGCEHIEHEPNGLGLAVPRLCRHMGQAHSEVRFMYAGGNCPCGREIFGWASTLASEDAENMRHYLTCEQLHSHVVMQMLAQLGPKE